MTQTAIQVKPEVSIQPFHYQFPVIQAVKKSLETRDAILFTMATGLGKTITSAFIVRDFLWAGKRGLFLCHENDILAQAEQEYRKVNGNHILYKTFYGQHTKDWSADTAQMLFASFQSLNNWHEKWYQAFEPTHFDFMVVDESHHGQALSYKEVINYFSCKKIGMTATPDRMDEKNIREIFGEEVYSIPLEEGIANRWLADVEYHIVSDGIDNRKLSQICKKVLNEGKRLSVKQINESIFIKERDLAEKLIIEEYSQIKKLTKSKQTMIFCENIEHADNLSKYFKKVGVVHSEMSEGHNTKTLRDFKKGKLQYILSVDKFNEGVDVPDVEVVVFLRATNSMTVFFQQLGRGLHKKAGVYKKVVVLDFVANCERLIMVRDLMNRVKDLAPKEDKLSLLDANPFHISGKGFDFTFSDQLVDVMKVIEALRKGFYPTWQEASEVAIGLGIKTNQEYGKRYKEDIRLPSFPYVFYKDFPTWPIFLNTQRLFYQTWQEASVSAVNLGIKSKAEYYERFQEDKRLPSSPYNFYSDFPGIKKFLSTEKFYKTWQEASKKAQELKIKSFRDYLSKRKADSNLPASPDDCYKDFPGWYIFLGKANPLKYTRSILIKQLQKYSKSLKRTPTHREISRYSKKGLIAKVSVFQKMFGTINNAFTVAGLKINLEVNFKGIDKKTLIKQLQDEALRLKRTPTGTDINKACKEGRMASTSTFHKLFGSLTSAYKAAKLKVVRVWRYENKELLIKQLKREAKRLKRTPTKNDIEKACKAKRVASMVVFRRLFGKWSIALKKTGLK